MLPVLVADALQHFLGHGLGGAQWRRKAVVEVAEEEDSIVAVGHLHFPRVVHGPVALSALGLVKLEVRGMQAPADDPVVLHARRHSGERKRKEKKAKEGKKERRS